jgi:hypothetical protein
MAARARQLRMVHCAEYPHASSWISAATANLSALFFLEARVVAGDALGMLKIQTEAGSVSVGHAFGQI